MTRIGGRCIGLWVGMVVALLAVSAAPLRVAAEPPLADRVPADAILYVGWSGAESMGPGYAGSHLKAVIDASSLPELINESMPRLLENLGHGDEDAEAWTGLLSAVGGPMWRHPTAIYFGGADLTNPDAPLPRVSIICQAGKEAGAMVEAVRTRVAHMDPPPPFPVLPEEQDGLVVINLGAMAVSAKQKPAPALSARKEFVAAMGQVAKDPVAALYLDVDAAVAFHDQIAAKFAPAQAKPTIEAVKEALGIKSLKRIAWGAGFDAKEWSSQAYLESPEPRSGLVKFLLEAKPLSDQALRTIPATATMAAAGHFDLGGLLGTVREMVRKIDPPTSQDFEGGLDQVKQMIGMDLQGDILDTLGDEWVVYSNPAVGGSGILGLTVVNRLKEPAKAEQALGQLEKLLNGMMKEGMAGGPVTVAFNTVQQGDLTIHYLAVPFVAPSWAIKDGVLYAGLYPQVISGAYEHVKSGGKSILDNPDFVALRKRLTPEGRSVTAISYSDLPKVTTEGYQEVLMLARVYLGMADLFGAKTPAMAMPTLTKLLPHVTPAAGIAWPDKDGYHFKEISPFPGSQILAAGGMGPALAAEQTIFMGVALPALAKARINANRIKSASNLRMIGQAMLLYANENKGKYPAEMGELLLTQDITIDVFVNPETRTRAPRNQDKEALAAWVSKDSDYEYLGAGKTNQTPPNVIVAHEKFRPNAVGVNLLFGDGHVEFLYKQAAEQAIAKQKQDEIMKKGGK